MAYFTFTLFIFPLITQLSQVSYKMLENIILILLLIYNHYRKFINHDLFQNKKGPVKKCLVEELSNNHLSSLTETPFQVTHQMFSIQSVTSLSAINLYCHTRSSGII